MSMSNYESNRLAILKTLRYDIEGAMATLRNATLDIEEKHNHGKILLPFNGHIAKVINEIRINPVLLTELKKIQKLDHKAKIKNIASIVSKHPSYFGAALYLINELRSQGVLDKITKSIDSKKASNKIPKIIMQYWNDDILPNEIKIIMRSWRRLNPDFEYKLFSRRTAFQFIKENYTELEVNAFKNCEHPAMQADFFRLAFLNVNGGFYADADDKCIQPLNQLTDIGTDLILKLGDFGCFANNFIACTANNPLIKHTFEKGVNNLLNYFNEGPWFRLGPGHLTSCITFQLAKHVNEPDIENWPRLFVLKQEDSRKMFSQHLSLSYKRTERSWFKAQYKSQNIT